MSEANKSFEQSLTGDLDQLANQVQLYGPLRSGVDDIVEAVDGRGLWFPTGRMVFLMVSTALLVVAGVAVTRSAADELVEPVTAGAAHTELVVWLQPGIAEDEALVTGRKLVDGPGDIEVAYVNSDATYAEFAEFFADQPELLELIEPESLPTSFVVVVAGDPQEFVEWVERLPGVDSVEVASDDS